MDFDAQIRILLLGESGAGKTSLLLRFTDDMFERSTVSTVGVDFRVKKLTLQWRRVRLQIWDTNGQERFRSITRSYYRGAQGVVLVYDAGDRRSFHNVTRWMADIKQHATEQNVVVMLVANKVDLPAEKRLVSAEMGRQLAEEIGQGNGPGGGIGGCSYFETSALSGKGVPSTDSMSFLCCLLVLRKRLASSTGLLSFRACAHLSLQTWWLARGWIGVEEAFTSMAEHIVFGRPRPMRRALLGVRQRLLWAQYVRTQMPLKVLVAVGRKLGGAGRAAMMDGVLRRHDQAQDSRSLDSRWHDQLSGASGPRRPLPATLSGGSGRTDSVGGAGAGGGSGRPSNGGRVSIERRRQEDEEDGCC